MRLSDLTQTQLDAIGREVCRQERWTELVSVRVAGPDIQDGFPDDLEFRGTFRGRGNFRTLRRPATCFAILAELEAARAAGE